jgi:bifunctional DNA-binding transcriptional regulator/antitoxin component of YhaV-PrlF toxin-antitoxin module
VVKPGEDQVIPEEDRENPGLAVKVVVAMVKRKLGVTITPMDLRTCHYTQNGAIIFRMGDLKYNSPYDEMVKAIKSGKNREILVYFNLMLTRRRTDLLYHVRLGKRAGNIYRFFSDCDGSITIIPKEGDSRVRITDSYDVTSKTQSTMTVNELEVRYRRS